jgi:hypothetical protein
MEVRRVEEQKKDAELMNKISEVQRQWVEGLLNSRESINIIVGLFIESVTEEEEENGKN